MHFFQSLNILSFGSSRLDRRNVRLGQIRNQVIAGNVTGTERHKESRSVQGAVPSQKGFFCDTELPLVCHCVWACLSIFVDSRRFFSSMCIHFYTKTHKFHVTLSPPASPEQNISPEQKALSLSLPFPRRSLPLPLSPPFK